MAGDGEAREPRSLDELKDAIAELRSGVDWARTTFDPEALERRRDELDREMEAPGFWDDQRAAARSSAERSRVQNRLDTIRGLERDTAEMDSMLELAGEDAEWQGELERTIDRLGRSVA